ncbi:MAG TPA: DUF4836 family protein [Puia sp.]|nr:DUF4836 family protein [Puia sp.]
MKKALRPSSLLATLLFTTIFVSAQNPNPLFRHLPPNAERIYHINLPALTSKVSWEDLISAIPPSKSTSNQQVMDILKDPSLAGVDIRQDLFIAQSGGDNKYDSTTYITLLVHLTDSGKFIAFMNGMEKDLHPLPMAKGPARASAGGRLIGKDKTVMAYDDKLAVITIVTPAAKEVAASIQKSAPGKKKAPIAMAHTLKAGRMSMAALRGFTNTIYTADPVFTAGFSDDADFHMWGPHGEGANKLMEMVKKKAMKDKNAISMTRSTGLHTLTALRFEPGKITMLTTTKVPQDSLKNYRILNSRPLNTDLINRLPGKAILGMVNLHFDPAFLTEFLERSGLRKTFDSALSSKGLTINDVIKAFKGDFLIAGMQPATLPDSGKGNPNIFFVTTIDPAAFMKLAGKLKLDSAGNLMGKMKTTYTLKDNILVAGKNKTLTDEYFSTTAVHSSNDLVNDRVRTNAFSLAVDVKAIIAFMQEIYPNPTPKTQQLLHFLGALDRLTYTAGDMQNGLLESYFELKMADASENSLRSIFKLLH